MTPSEVVSRLIQAFDGRTTLKLDDAVAQILQEDGLGESDAFVDAERMRSQILYLLSRQVSAVLPFDVRGARTPRLVGKLVPRSSDTPIVAEVRERLELVDVVLEAVLSEGDRAFEYVSAKLMILAGSSESHVTGRGNDGGIDLYGRIPLRGPSEVIPVDLLRTSFLDRGLLFFGQAKCYEPTQRIDRAELQKFNGQVDDCLRKYEGNSRPPAHRVPDDYFQRQESCVRVFFATAGFGEGASSYASSVGLIPVGGRQIAEQLVLHGIGIEVKDGRPAFSQTLFRKWLGPTP